MPRETPELTPSDAARLIPSTRSGFEHVHASWVRALLALYLEDAAAGLPRTQRRGLPSRKVSDRSNSQRLIKLSDLEAWASLNGRTLLSPDPEAVAEAV